LGSWKNCRCNGGRGRKPIKKSAERAGGPERCLLPQIADAASESPTVLEVLLDHVRAIPDREPDIRDA